VQYFHFTVFLGCVDRGFSTSISCRKYSSLSMVYGLHAAKCAAYLLLLNKYSISGRVQEFGKKIACSTPVLCGLLTAVVKAASPECSARHNHIPTGEKGNSVSLKLSPDSGSFSLKLGMAISSVC